MAFLLCATTSSGVGTTQNRERDHVTRFPVALGATRARSTQPAEYDRSTAAAAPSIGPVFAANGNDVSHRAVAALAVIKVNWDDNKDYIANFVPVVAHCLRESAVDAISLPETQSQIDRDFGLRIPQGPLKTILNRMAREGMVERSHGVYRKVAEALKEINLGPTRESVLRQHAHLVKRLQEFAGGLGREWTEDQADRALTAYVEHLAEPILGAVVEGEPVVDLPQTESEGSVVVSRFVLNLCQQEPEAFDYLETVVKGSMLANVLFLPEAFSSGTMRLGDIEVYLDTPIVLRGLGYAEEQYRAPAQELISLLQAEGATLRVFEHTRHEVEGVLDGAAMQYRTGPRADSFPGDVVDYFASESMSRSDVELAIASLGQRLDDRDIEVVPTPDHEERLNVAEDELEGALETGVRYHRREPLVKDLNSLTAVHRLRQGELRRHIEHCDAVLVTTNTALARVGNAFFAGVYGARGVPVCMADAALSALAWLMNPTQAPDLPRRQIIATSYAALNPPDSVWRKYLKEIRQLQERGELTETQVGLLLFSPDARVELMNATGGEVDAFAEGTVAQVLRYAEAAARAEVQSELAEERDRRAQAEEEIAAEKKRTEQAVAQVRDVTTAHVEHLGQVAHKVAVATSWVVFTLGVVLILVATVAATSPLFPDSWSRSIPLGSVLVALLLLGGLASLVWGWTVLDVRAWAEKKIEPAAASALKRWLTPSSD